MTEKTGKLYLVGTPIGNLGDMTLRAIATLKSVDAIACEDTRRTRALLAHFGIPARDIYSLHARSAESRIADIAGILETGKTLAYVTDAGMPTLSDPGLELVTLAAEKGIPVEVIPGVSAASTAIACAPFANARFFFEGFLPRKGVDRSERLNAIAKREEPTILFEAPSRVKALLGDLAEFLGDGRRVVVARELTKLHEQVITFRLADRNLASFPEKGEFTIVVEGVGKDDSAGKKQMDERERNHIAESLVKLRRDGVSNRDILKVLKVFLPDTVSELRDLVLKDDEYDK